VFCSDPFVAFLKAQGYCAVRVPRADLKPLQLLAMQSGALERLGALEEVLVADGVALPDVARAVPLPAFSGRRTGSLSAGIGISLLGDALKAMGISPPSFDVEVRPGTAITLAMEGVTEDRVEVASLDRYLAAADVLPGAPSVAALLESDDVYVITAVVRCRRLLVSASRTDGHGVAVRAPELHGVLGAHASLSGDRDSATGLTYEGRTPVAFGFKAVRLLFENGRYGTLRAVSPGRVMRGGAAMREPDRLEVAGPFARLR